MSLPEWVQEELGIREAERQAAYEQEMAERRAAYDEWAQRQADDIAWMAEARRDS